MSADRLKVFSPKDISRSLIEKQKLVELEPWFIPHPLVICNSPVIKSQFLKAELDLITQFSGQLFKHMAQEYAKRQSPVVLFDEGKLIDLLSQSEYISPPEAQFRMTILNPLFLSEPPQETQEVLDFLCRRGEEINPNLPSEHRDRLRDTLPEVDFGWGLGEKPYIMTTGIRIATKMNAPKEYRLKVGYTNVIFQKDQDYLFRSLPSEWKKIVGWMMMAKWGAFRNILAFWGVENGELNYSLRLNTLEGGRPELSIDELTRRIRALGSAVELGKYRKLEGFDMPMDIWRELPEVLKLIKLGQYSGKKDMLSPRVKFEELVRNPLLSTLEADLAGYGSQAEGANQGVIVYPDDTLVRALNLPFDVIPFSTRTGKFGVVKTDPKLTDFSPIGAFDEDGTVGVISINGEVFGAPSIEAFELMNADKELALQDPERFIVRLSRVGDGYVEDPNGSVKAPVVARKFHFHRSVIINNRKKFIPVSLDVEQNPPAFCGSDHQAENTKKGIEIAVNLREQEGNQAIGAVLEMDNHGCLILMFWPKEGGEDPTLTFIEAVERGDIELFFPVRQK